MEMILPASLNKWFLVFYIFTAFNVISAELRYSDNIKLNNSEQVLLMSDVFYITAKDNPAHSHAVSDRSDWTKRHFGGLPLKDKNIWLQVDFEVHQQTEQRLGLLIMMVASYEAYWDGELLGKNGLLGINKQTEVPGQIEFGVQLLKKQLAVGRHTLSLKVASHHNSTNNEVGSFYIFSGEYPEVVMHSHKSAMLPLVMTGAFFLLALYCFFLYFTAIKDLCYLLFGGLSLIILLLFITESWRGLWGYSYDWHIPRLELVLMLTSTASLLLAAYFSFFFNMAARQRYIIISMNILLQINVLIFVDGYDTPSLLLILIGIITSTYACIYAVIKKQQNARLMLAGLVFFTVPLVMDVRLYMEQYFFVSFAILIGIMLYTLTQTMKVKQQQLMQSKINTSRLELELIKKNLQPHFILNTLTAVEEWIEESPTMAVKFIDALADEFRQMAKISSLSLISIQDEIKMCEAHLKVMEFRTETTFELLTECMVSSQYLPPGVLLTLVENAISHNAYQKQKVTFKIQQCVKNNEVELVFTAPIVTSDKTAKLKNNMINLGIGSQYIEARLRESFRDSWDIKSKQTVTDWEITITLPLSISNKV